MYSCKQCGASATMENAVLKKSCECKCGVTMDMGTATLVNFSSLNEKLNAKEMAVALINFIVGRVKELSGKAKCN